jgi:K+-sensing histidine kinase KdpD
LKLLVAKGFGLAGLRSDPVVPTILRILEAEKQRGRYQHSLRDRPLTKGDEAISDLPKKIHVATDGSAGSVTAVRRAAEMAHAFGSELHVVHVVPVSQPYHLFGANVEGVQPV